MSYGVMGPSRKVGPWTSGARMCGGTPTIPWQLCVNGNLEEEEITKKQFESLVRLAAWLWEEWGVMTWLGHGELELTLCPGAQLSVGRVSDGGERRVRAMEVNLDIQVLYACLAC